ncbi:hypothetical protein Tco_1321554 [Tanacetum coccineum]
MVKMVSYEAFVCSCGAGDVVLRQSYKPLAKTLSDVNFFCGRRNESVYWLVLLELHDSNSILKGSSSTLIYSPGSSTPPCYSPGASTPPSYSLGTSRNAE